MKKRNLLLSLLLAGSLVTPVFADDSNINYGDNENSPTIYLKKVLKTPTGTSLPEGGFTFKFNFTLLSHDGTTNSEKLQDYNGILPSKTINITSDNIVNDNIDTSDVTEYSRSIDILEGVIFSGAGEYIYEVTEANPSSTATESNTEDNDTGKITYDTNSYQLRILVKNKKDNGTYVSSVEIVSGTSINAGKFPDKSAKLPANDPNTTKFVFTNTYTKDAGFTDQNNPNVPVDENRAALVISKTVTREDNIENLVDKERKFDFTLTLISNSIDPINNENEIKAFIDSTPVSFQQGAENTFTATFQLKHEQELIINSLPGGTKYTVNETGTTNYIPSAIVTTGGVNVSNGFEAKTDESLTVENQVVNSDGLNKTAYTNTFNTNIASPTGIIINNLPYILLVVVGVAGIALYEAGRRRFNN